MMKRNIKKSYLRLYFVALFHLSILIAYGQSVYPLSTFSLDDYKSGDVLPSTGTQQLPPQISHVSTVAPNVLCLEIDACKILPIIQIPYIAETSDVITVGGETLLGEPRDMFVERDGFQLGSLVGSDRKTLVIHDRLAGKHLETKIADMPASYAISSLTDNQYSKALVPLSVSRKTKPTGWTDTSWKMAKEQFYTAKHYLYLKLPYELKTGNSYLISLPGLNLKESSVYYVHDPVRVRSEAVHVSQIGFRADDPDKNAFLSVWMGKDGGYTYPEDQVFWLVDDKTNEKVFEGKAILQWKGSEPEGIGTPVNHSATDVLRLDFSTFNTPGRYRVCVDGVGCGYAFNIDEESTWKHAFAISMKGHYNHRSGIPMLPPYTDFVRPRSFHPSDGVKVYQSKCSLLNSGNGLNAMGTDRGNFQNLVAGKTDVLVPEAWGGTMDAGDWDRRINHVFTPRLYLELVELFPEYFRTLNLNIPESGNNIPDVVDEALFGLDIYRRMQMPDGGIRGGVESSEHPNEGSTSWQESLTVLAYAPDHWSSYLYAGVAARAAYVLKIFELNDEAKVWEESAVKAMEWAEVEYAKWINSPDYEKVTNRAKGAVPRERNLASVELYRLTKKQKWHQIFLDTQEKFSASEAAFVYARLDLKLVDIKTHNQLVDKIIANADDILETAKNGAYGITTGREGRSLGGYPSTFTIPAEPTLVRAHVLSNDEKYLKAILRSTLFTAGANPMNLSLTSGLGENYVKNILHEDSKHTGQPAPIGISVFGPSEMKSTARPNSEVEQRLLPGISPAPAAWPTYESYFDVFWIIPQNEYVIDRPLGQAAYIWGYLASRN